MVTPGQKLKIEKLDEQSGDSVIFDKVLLVEKSNKIEIGAPYVAGAKVAGKVVSQGKGKKVIAFRYGAKKRLRVKKGHRQQYTEVEIKTIDLKA